MSGEGKQVSFLVKENNNLRRYSVQYPNVAAEPDVRVRATLLTARAVSLLLELPRSDNCEPQESRKDFPLRSFLDLWG